MADVAQWMKAQIEKHRVEANAGLGKAIAYMTARWDKLTLFLRVGGAPLDSNIAEFCGANPCHYLVALQRHEKMVTADPARRPLASVERPTHAHQKDTDGPRTRMRGGWCHG